MSHPSDCWALFDVRQTGFHAWDVLAVGGAVFVVSLLLFILGRHRRRYLWFGPAFVALLVGTWVPYAWYQREEAIDRLEHGRCETIQGYVEVLEPVPPHIKGSEILRVGGVRFSYSDATTDPGMNETERKASGLKIGQLVRVSYFDGEILRVEQCLPR